MADRERKKRIAERAMAIFCVHDPGLRALGAFEKAEREIEEEAQLDERFRRLMAESKKMREKLRGELAS